MITTYVFKFFLNLGLSGDTSYTLACLTVLCLIVLVSFITKFIFENFLVRFLHSVVAHAANNTWNEILIKNGVTRRLALIIPAVVIYYFIVFLFPQKSLALVRFIHLACLIYIITMCVVISDAILNSIAQICDKYRIATKTPVKSFMQMLKVLVVLVAIIVIVSLLMHRSPWTLLKALGALTAVAMLVFKDPILGFVASIQLSAQDMVHRGDWVEMPKYGANGDVIDISLTTVKVQNFDKTIVSIPTYALVSNSFQNWRGMVNAGGRRIKRAINIDMNSLKFLAESDIERLKKFEYLGDYLNFKVDELDQHNKKISVNTTDSLLNGRRLTNVGTFRYYVKQYLRNHSKIHDNMTFMIRQLQPTEKGLPLEIYVFTTDTNWVNYEEIQADIFDHLLTSVPEFGLSIYQDPTGLDFRGWKSS